MFIHKWRAQLWVRSFIFAPQSRCVLCYFSYFLQSLHECFLCQTVQWYREEMLFFLRCIFGHLEVITVLNQQLKLSPRWKKCKLEFVDIGLNFPLRYSFNPADIFTAAFGWGSSCDFYFETCSSSCIFIKYIIKMFFLMKQAITGVWRLVLVQGHGKPARDSHTYSYCAKWFCFGPKGFRLWPGLK